MEEPKIYKYNYRSPSYPPYNMPEISSELVNAVVQTCITEFADKKIGFVCRGSSGLYLATICAERLLPKKSNVIYIRKPEEEHNSHGNDIENFCDLDVYIVVDDVIASGNTIREIISGLKKHCADIQNKHIGIVAKYCHDSKEKFDADGTFFKFFIV